MRAFTEMGWLLGGGLAVALFLHVVVDVDWTQSIAAGIIVGSIAMLTEHGRRNRQRGDAGRD